MDDYVFGKLVQSLRKEHRDMDGLPWTQQMLALRSGIEKRAIERIEQGLLRKIEPDVVCSLADALELTAMERKEFFFAALGVESSHLASTKSDPIETLNTLLAVLGSVKFPALISDVYADVIATNRALVKLFALEDELLIYPADGPLTYNLMRVVFCPDSKYRRALSNEWERSAKRSMHIFRSASLRYRCHPYFKQILAALWKYPAFRLYWEQAHLEDADTSVDSIIYEYTHQKFGPLRYMTNASTAPTRLGELYLGMYIPMDRRTSDVFEDLVQRNGYDVVRLSRWPKQ